jgi:hypothetical protein
MSFLKSSHVERKEPESLDKTMQPPRYQPGTPMDRWVRNTIRFLQMLAGQVQELRRLDADVQIRLAKLEKQVQDLESDGK